MFNVGLFLSYEESDVIEAGRAGVSSARIDERRLGYLAGLSVMPIRSTSPGLTRIESPEKHPTYPGSAVFTYKAEIHHDENAGGS
jgi:hypothetical protein